MKDVDARVQYGIQFGKSRGFIKSGDPIVIVTGWKSGSGFTNTIRIVYVENEKKEKQKEFCKKKMQTLKTLQAICENLQKISEICKNITKSIAV